MVTRRGRAALTPLFVVFGVLAAMVAVVLTVASGGQHYADLGLPDAGPLTEDGLAVLNVVNELAAAVCIGSLLMAAFLVPPRRGGGLAADGYAAVRMAGWSALVWCVAALLLVPFTVADALGRPVTQMTWGALFPLTFTLDQPVAWLVTACLALLVAIGCRLTLSWGWSTVLFFAALACLLPQAATGHSSAGGSHDLATDSLIYHLFGASIWVGGLVALLAHARRGGPHLALVTGRFSAVALVCWLVMAVSGVINALVRVQVHDLFVTAYGLIVVGKIVALLTLGVVGYLQRKHAVTAVAATGSRRVLLRLAGAEMLIMFVTIGISAALSRTAPPTDDVPIPTSVDVLIGYDLNGPPTVFRLLFDWRFDLVFGVVSILLGVLYLLGVRRLRRRGDRWPVGRTVAWLAGCALVLVATSSGVGRYAPAVFSVHMASHMALNMLAPALLVLGGPITLAMRALTPAGKDGQPGPREWLLAFVQSPVTKFLTHPLVAFVLFIGSYYTLYFTGLFEAALNEHWAHLAMNSFFVLIGYAFYWPIIGIDPAPRRLPYLGRLGLLLASMPFHAFFGVILMNMHDIVGGEFYRSLALPWMTNLAADQHLAGGIAWAFGEIPLIVVVIALLSQWARHDERDARRSDRRADADGDAELVAYNAMLGELAGRGSRPAS
jgi:putative copper resistance protein D